MRDSGLVSCEDDHVGGHGCECREVGVHVLEGSDRDGSGRCGYGRGEHGHGEYDRGECDRDVNGRGECDRDVNDHRVDGRHHGDDLHGNDLSVHVRRASAHAHDAHGRRRSCR